MEFGRYIDDRRGYSWRPVASIEPGRSTRGTIVHLASLDMPYLQMVQREVRPLARIAHRHIFDYLPPSICLKRHNISKPSPRARILKNWSAMRHTVATSTASCQIEPIGNENNYLTGVSPCAAIESKRKYLRNGVQFQFP